MSFKILDMEQQDEETLVLSVKLYLSVIGKEVTSIYMDMYITKQNDGLYLTYIQGKKNINLLTKQENKKLSESTTKEINKMYKNKYGKDFYVG